MQGCNEIHIPVTDFKTNIEMEILKEGNQKLSSAASTQITEETQIKLPYVMLDVLHLLPKL